VKECVGRVAAEAGEGGTLDYVSGATGQRWVDLRTEIRSSCVNDEVDDREVELSGSKKTRLRQ